MDKPRFRFTVWSTMLALLVGLYQMPAHGVVRVDARGLGHEHLNPSRLHGAFACAYQAAGQRWSMWRHKALALTTHPLFKPLTATALVVGLSVLDVRALIGVPFVLGATLTEGQHAGEFLAWEATSFKREAVTVLSGQSLSPGAVIGRVSKGIGRAVGSAVTGTGNGTLGSIFAGPEIQVGTYTLTCTAAATNAGTFSVTCPDGKALPGATVGSAYVSRHVNFTIADGSTDFVVGDAFTITVSTTAPVVSGTGNGTISALSLAADAKPGRYRFVCTTATTNGGTFTVTGPDGDVLGIFTMTAGAGTATAFTTRQINFTLTDAGTDFAAGDVFEVVVFNQLSGGKAVAWDPTTFDGRHDASGVLVSAVDASTADKSGAIIARDAVVMKGALQWGASITAAQKESAYLDLAKRGIIARDSVV